MKLFSFFFQQLSYRKYSMMLVVILAFIGNILPRLTPLFFKQITDLGIDIHQGIRAWSELWSPVIGLTIVIFITVLIWRLLETINMGSYLAIIKNTYSSLFCRVLGYDLGYFQDTFTGKIGKSLFRLSGTLEDMMDVMIYSVSRNVVTIVIVSIVFFHEHVLLGTFALIGFMVFLLISYATNKIVLPDLEKSWEADSKMGWVVQDIFSNISTVTTFGRASYEKNRIDSEIENCRRLGYKSWSKSQIIWASLSIMSAIIQIGLIFISTYLFIQKSITFGTLILVITYLSMMMETLWDITHQIRRFMRDSGNAEEGLKILGHEPVIKDSPNSSALSILKPTIDISSITFQYAGASSKVFENFSLSIHPGEKIALVGPSGSGKSTITKLLFRIYDIQGWSIRIDGQDIRMVTQESLRQSIAYVPQESILFHRSIEENIAYGRPEATKEEIINAAKKAFCHDFIKKLPDGYASLVGERGVKLSGGERQRVAIARAFLRNASILILDEPTASLDSESEAYIQTSLEELMRDRTCLVIAHRLSTIMHMDRIIVLEHGKIIEEGIHHDLLAKGSGLYQRLWKLQSEGFVRKE